jgi:hypothetical protein
MNELQIKTVQDENFILVVDSVNKIICFLTESNLKLLCSVDKIFVDVHLLTVQNIFFSFLLST